MSDIKFMWRGASESVEFLDMDEECTDEWPVIAWRDISLIGTPPMTLAEIAQEAESTK